MYKRQVKGSSNLTPRFYVSASGSSGTLAAGDYLKDKLQTKIAVVEALECPTLLHGGYGEHNIQGIGDKHVPLIHNVMNTDFVVDVSDQATNNLNMIFNTEIGKKFLIEKKNFEPDFVSRLPEFGFSAIANILASIKLAKYMDLNSDDAIITVATDGADLYISELNKTIADFKNNYDEVVCAELFGKHLSGISTDNMLELSYMDKKRIFNLGYFTWVEQQGVNLEEFEKRKDQKFWNSHYEYMLSLDNKIKEFNNM